VVNILYTWACSQRSLRAGYRGSGGLPYEFRALEAALSSITSALEEEWNVHRQAVDKIIGPLEAHIGKCDPCVKTHTGC
jgi:hypothetical protein